MAEVRLIFAGTPEVAVPSLDALLAAGHDVVAVLTRPDAPVGRKRLLTPSPVKTRALELGLPVITASKLRGEVLDEIAAYAPQAVPIVAYGAIVGPRALAIPEHGWVNLHFSLLPRWRGAAPVQHAILAGDERSGATVFRLDEGLDTGPVLGSLETPIGSTDTSGILLERLAREGAALLARTIGDLERGAAHAVPQPSVPDADAPHAPKLLPEDARIDWAADAGSVDRRIRATHPAPGAWTTLGGARFKLGPVRPWPEAEPLPPGRLGVAATGEVLVGTGSAPVVLGVVRPPGKGEMPAADWHRGSTATSFDPPGDAGDPNTTTEEKP